MPAVGPCPKCGGSMTEGFVVDDTHGGKLASTWAEGPPVKSFWTGVKFDKASRRQIASWRCNKCGFLENYAR